MDGGRKASSLKALGFRKLISIATMLVILMAAAIWIVPNFREWWLRSFPPPIIVEVDDWDELSYCIESLQERSSTIVRAEILSKVTDLREAISDSERFETFYIEYQVRVLEVFKGQVDLDDIIKIFQYTHIKLYGYQDNMLLSETRTNFTSLEIGDDLILFLLPGYSDRLTVTSQSAYHFTLEHFRFEYGMDNWKFESYDPRNKLNLTANDLLEITAAHRNAQN